MRITDRPTTIPAKTSQTTQSNPLEQLQKMQQVFSAQPTAAVAPRAPVAVSTGYEVQARSAAAGATVVPDAPITDERLLRAIGVAYKNYYGGSQYPNLAERTELMAFARELRDQGKSATEIEYALTDKVRLKAEGLDNTTDATLNRLIGQAYAGYYGAGQAPSAALRNELLAYARDLASGEDPKTAEQIKYALADKVRLKAEGLDDTTNDTLNRLITQAYKEVSGGRLPSPQERAAWLAYARGLADGEKKMSAEQIKFALGDKIRVSFENL